MSKNGPKKGLCPLGVNYALCEFKIEIYNDVASDGAHCFT
jgi:hypothetical protein